MERSISKAGSDQEMDTMRTSIKRLAGNRNGATAIEYGLIAGLIAVAVITGVTSVGTTLSSVFTNVNTKLATAVPTA